MSKYHYVYKITNLLNNKIYIGKRSSIKTPKEDIHYWGSGKKIILAIRKYGKDSFTKTILKEFTTAEEAFKYEKKLVNEDFVRKQNTYNIAVGGWSGPVMVGPDNPNFGVPMSEERKRQHSLRMSGEGHPNFGKRLPKDTVEKIRKANTGYRHSDSSRDKLRRLNLGKKLSSETRAKMADGRREGHGNNMAKWFYHTPFGVYESLAQASNELQCTSSLVESRCTRKCNKTIKRPTGKSGNLRQELRLTKEDVGKTYRQCGWYVEKIK